MLLLVQPPALERGKLDFGLAGSQVPAKKVATAGQMPARPGRFLISCFRVASQELKCAIACAQPTP